MANTYSFVQFQEEYPNNDACLDKLMELRYGSSPICESCDRETKYHRITGRRAYACQFCGAHVYPCVGTPFEKSSTDLYKWFYAMYLFTTTRHGVSAKELERSLDVTYKCAWRMAHEIRKLMAKLDTPDLVGDVEADETYVGGKRRNGPRGRGALGKTIVMGMKERKGPIKTEVVTDVRRSTLEPLIFKNVKKGSTIHTDELLSYAHLGYLGFKHETVQHGIKQWVRGKTHVNSLEGHWSLLKRSIRGTHVHVSKRHMPKYLAEFDFRHNLRFVPTLMFPILVGMMAR